MNAKAKKLVFDGIRGDKEDLLVMQNELVNLIKDIKEKVNPQATERLKALNRKMRMQKRKKKPLIAWNNL